MRREIWFCLCESVKPFVERGIVSWSDVLPKNHNKTDPTSFPKEEINDFDILMIIFKLMEELTNGCIILVDDYDECFKADSETTRDHWRREAFFSSLYIQIEEGKSYKGRARLICACFVGSYRIHCFYRFPSDRKSLHEFADDRVYQQFFKRWGNDEDYENLDFSEALPFRGNYRKFLDLPR